MGTWTISSLPFLGPDIDILPICVLFGSQPFCASAVLVLSVALSAQVPRRLTIQAIYDPDQRVDFSGAPPTNLRWIDDDSYLQTRRTNGSVEWLKVDAVSGRSSPLFDAARMEAAFAGAGVTKDEAAGVARSGDLQFNARLDGGNRRYQSGPLYL